MGSKRFYEHAQDLLGGVKREVGIVELRGQKGYYCSKMYYIIMLSLYCIILLYYHYIISYYNYSSIILYWIYYIIYYIIKYIFIIL